MSCFGTKPSINLIRSKSHVLKLNNYECTKISFFRGDFGGNWGPKENGMKENAILSFSYLHNTFRKSYKLWANVYNNVNGG